MRPATRRRLLLRTLMMQLLAVVAFALGAALVLPWVTWLGTRLGIDSLIIASRWDVLHAQLVGGATLALPFVLGWIAMLIHRIRARVDPSSVALVSYVVVPFVGAAAAGLREVVLKVLSFSMTSMPTEIAPSFTLPYFVPTSCLTYCLFAGVVLWVVVAVRARPHAPRDPA